MAKDDAPEFFVYFVHSKLRDEDLVLDLDGMGGVTLKQQAHGNPKHQQWRVYRLDGRIQNAAMADDDPTSGFLTPATASGLGAVSLQSVRADESQAYGYEPGLERKKYGPAWNKTYTVLGRPVDAHVPLGFVLTAGGENEPIALAGKGDPSTDGQNWWFVGHP